MKHLVLFAALFAAIVPTIGPDVSSSAQAPATSTPSVRPDGKKPATGKVYDPAKSKAKRLAHNAKHGDRAAHIHNVAVTSFDLRTLGCVPPVKDQGSCGSCYIFGGTDTCEIALMKAGKLTVDGGGLAEQYSMDCKNVGGCGGGDEADIITICRDTGLPLTKDYGAYSAREGNCKQVDSARFVKIDGFGYCSGNSDQANVEDIKKCLLQYGPISIAIDAGALGDGTGGPYVTGQGINHAVMLVGFDDAKQAFLMRNSWSSGWGNGGYCWLSYKAYIVEAIFVIVNAPNPPVPPGPTPPGPTPPGVVNLPLTPEQVEYVVSQSGKGFTKDTTLGQILASLQSQSDEVVITKDMTIQQVIDALAKRKQAPQRMPLGPTPDCKCKACSCSPCKCTANMPPMSEPPVVADPSPVLSQILSEQRRTNAALLDRLDDLTKRMKLIEEKK